MDISPQKVLVCAFCIKVRKPEEVKVASTIMSGFAVCVDHAYYVQDAVFNRILAIIKADEHKEHESCLKSTSPSQPSSGAPSASPRSRSISSRVRSAVSSVRTPDPDGSQ